MTDTIYSSSVSEMLYSQAQANGVIVIVVASTISLIGLTGLLVSLIFVALRPKFNTTADYLFLQSNFGLYFVSLLVANTIAAVGSFMNVRWVENKAVTAGGFCTAQGSIKNIGNVATALWTLVIAIHVFNLLFLRHETKRIAGIFTTIGIWCSVGTIDIFGPAILEKRSIGPYFGVAGFWCWITDDYTGARVGLEYFWFFFSGAMSFVLYMLVFLRSRGNIVFLEGSHLPKFIWVPRAKAWKLQANRDVVDAHMTDVAKQMIWFPVAYTIVIIPIAIDRFVSDAGTNVPFEWIIFSDSLFMSLGLINVILFVSTRTALPKEGLLPTFNIPRKPPPSVFIPPASPKNGDIDPYVVSSSASDKSFGTPDRNSQKYNNVAMENEKVVVTNLGGTFKGHNRNGSGYVMPSPRPVVTSFASQSAPVRAPSPNDQHRMHSRQSSMDSFTLGRNPFGDDQAPSPSSESEDEYDGYGRRRTEWQPSLSAYFDEVDLATPRADRTRFSTGARDMPPLPTTRPPQPRNMPPNRI